MTPKRMLRGSQDKNSYVPLEKGKYSQFKDSDSHAPTSSRPTSIDDNLIFPQEIRHGSKSTQPQDGSRSLGTEHRHGMCQLRKIAGSDECVWDGEQHGEDGGEGEEGECGRDRDVEFGRVEGVDSRSSQRHGDECQHTLQDAQDQDGVDVLHGWICVLCERWEWYDVVWMLSEKIGAGR